MSSIPLPALDVRPPAQPPNPMEQYGQLMQLRNEMQNAPLQRQALQQQVQEGQIGVQQAQQGQRDQLAFRAAMQDPSMQGKSIGEVADLLAQKGAISQNAWQSAMKADTEHKQAIAKLTDTQLAAAKATHYQTQELYNNVMGMPDDQLAQNWAQIAQQFNAIPGQKQQLNPQQPLSKQQLSQFGPVISMGNAYIDQDAARRKAQTEQKTAEVTLGQKQSESQFYQQNGGAPGVSTELMQQADWLKKNPGKGPSDFLAWKAKQAPLAQFNMMNSTGAGQPAADVAKRFGYTPEAFDQAAERFASTGVLPPSGRGGAALAANKAIMNRAAELHAGESIAANSAEYKANSESLKKLTAFNDNVSAFEQTASKNFDLLQGTLKDIPDLGAKFANVPARMISSSMIGTEAMARFHTALNVAQTEAAKVLNNPNSSAVLSDSARGDLQKIIDGNLPVKAIVASLDTLRQDMKNRLSSNADTIAAIQSRIKGAGGSAPTTSPTGGNVVHYKIVNGKLVAQ